ncbi:MAG: TIGR03761 family integrating conjugative element protein [Candidatus Thiodiazotropha sp. (ex Lucinoma borealis)]|nr:TIGR03761 family integrating conjugative element protein [Candidatus Thiodiazotropha sp. (ex Lucinoma borealis)]MCU7866125.1 TIGR03761 family integrating conjugative element protein [Candidatus Thiodiazotropha sp. (ex Lucinoma borealis)]
MPAEIMDVAEESDIGLDANTNGLVEIQHEVSQEVQTLAEHKEVEAPKKLKIEGPGRLKTKGSIRVHTRSAHDLFYGRRVDKENGVDSIIGLMLFAANTKHLSLLCINDDPYAEAVLIKIESLFPDLEQQLKKHSDHFEQLLDNMEGIEISFHESIEPISIPLEFSTPYGFIAARLLAQFDKLVKLAYAAKQVGLITRKDWFQRVTKTKTLFRHVFSVSQHYRFSGAKRDDLAANNAIARKVIEKYGELPEEILTGKQRAVYVSQKHVDRESR